MILLNTTFSVDSPIFDDFISFLKETYIPLALTCGMYSPLVCEVCVPSEKNTLTGKPTRSIALQMRCPDRKTADDFRKEILPNLCYVIGDSWGPAVAMFDTELNVVYDHAKDGL